jgi:hypothetical protein
MTVLNRSQKVRLDGTFKSFVAYREQKLLAMKVTIFTMYILETAVGSETAEKPKKFQAATTRLG